MCVEVTDRAAVFIRRMVRFGGGSPGAGFRLTVTPGGCSGFASAFSVEEVPAPGDTVVESNGVRLFLPPETCALLRGRTVDHSETLLDSGFVFPKPGVAEPCACGAGTGRGPGPAKVTVIRAGGSCAKR
jgi:iron-sulfur cluster assembly accessory protein